MTQSHFVTGTTLTLLLAVAVLGNAPSATAESTDAADANAGHGRIEPASENEATTRLDVNARMPEAWIPKPVARSPKPDPIEAAVSTLLDVDVDANVTPTRRDEETSELARRVSAALLGQAKPANLRVARATKTSNDADDAGRVWHCGEWEELWQGRGNARTCEWQ